jgi:hypothetical protein
MYSKLKTIKKAFPPLMLIVIVRAIIGTMESGGIIGDDRTVWTVSVAVYSVYVAVVNWLKNRKRGDDPFKPIKSV